MGWYFLAIAIGYKNPVSVEGAERLWYDGETKKRDINQTMYNLRQQGMTFKAIGAVFGLTESATFLRIKRMKNKELGGEVINVS